MTNEDLLTIARRHVDAKFRDKSDPEAIAIIGAKSILQFAREVAYFVAKEKDAASPMSDSDTMPLGRGS